MPYEWSKIENTPAMRRGVLPLEDFSPEDRCAENGDLEDGYNEVLHLSAHNSLTPNGFVWFIGITAVMFLFPLFAVLGSKYLWMLLPFMLFALALVWFALRQSWTYGQVTETLWIGPGKLHLLHQNPGQDDKEWQANPYWVRAKLHDVDRPVPKYLTLEAKGHCVELGRFLSEEERVNLYPEILQRLARYA